MIYLFKLYSQFNFLFNYYLVLKNASVSDNKASATRITILSHGLNLTLTQVSYNNSTLVLSEVSPSLRHDVNTLNINQNSIQ